MAKLKFIKKVLFLKIVLWMDTTQNQIPDKPGYNKIFLKFLLF